MSGYPELNRRSIYEAKQEAIIENTIEAFTLLDIINAEFRSDPMSTQCFDARIVQRVRECVELRKKYAL